MSTPPAEEPNASTRPHGLVRFTPRGEDALDALVRALTADCSGTPEGIAGVLRLVRDAQLTELADALSTIADAADGHAHIIDTGLAPATEPVTGRQAGHPAPCSKESASRAPAYDLQGPSPAEEIARMHRSGRHDDLRHTAPRQRAQVSRQRRGPHR
jgi:hypothetical protein